MRRTALIFGTILTLTAGVWGGALASAASTGCTHEATASSASDAHDCCRAQIGDADAHHSEPQPASHDNADTGHDSSNAPHEKSATRDHAGESHAGMNCGGAGAASTPETGASAFGARALLPSSCADCCAGGSGQTPATAVVVVPEPGKVKRAAASAYVSARSLFAPPSAHVAQLAPTQHAPPAPAARRHTLISVYLI